MPYLFLILPLLASFTAAAAKPIEAVNLSGALPLGGRLLRLPPEGRLRGHGGRYREGWKATVRLLARDGRTAWLTHDDAEQRFTLRAGRTYPSRGRAPLPEELAELLTALRIHRRALPEDPNGWLYRLMVSALLGAVPDPWDRDPL